VHTFSYVCGGVGLLLLGGGASIFFSEIQSGCVPLSGIVKPAVFIPLFAALAGMVMFCVALFIP
jgi:hypothetical protein